MIIEESKAVGAQVWVAREGKAYAAPAPGGNVGSANKPDANDASWVTIGRIEQWDSSMKTDEMQDVYDSSTGLLNLADSIPTKQAMMLKFTTNVVTGLAIGLFFRTQNELTAASGQFNPLTGVSPRAWLKMQNYDHNGVLVLSADFWVRLVLSGGIKGGNGELVKPEFTAHVLKNTLNTMMLGQ